MRLRFFLLAGVLVGLGLLGYAHRDALRQGLFDLTGEEQLGGQGRGLGMLALDLIRPPLDLRPEVPMAHSGVNPFGINTFLQQEVEPAKRERQVQLIADAGFHWLRQEFPWSDIEIGGKGDFQDCRNGPCISAWDKYDQIVNLADQYGLEIIARLSAPPDWSRADGAARGAFAPPDNFADFADYAAAVAAHYQGRVRYFQIWNEPNIYPEWGDQPADPEAYTRLLCAAYTRLKTVDPEIVVLSGALAPTNQLGGINPFSNQATEINDFIFLQRMYQAGAKDCFDILSMQGYGLFSGPTDRRMEPINVNYARNQFIRDIMVRNGDERKAIWIAEMNWNVVPKDSGIATNFGQVTEEQQARYAPLAYRRAQAEWPWVGVNTFWFFKRASDAEKNQSWYYFRMADPDFTLLPVYAAMKDYMHQPPVMYPGWFQEDHWAVQWGTGWAATADARATFGRVMATSTPAASAQFVFDGTELQLAAMRGPEAGQLTVRVDGQPHMLNLSAQQVEGPMKLTVVSGLRSGQHTVEITSDNGHNAIDGFIARNGPERTGAILVVIVVVLGGAWYCKRHILKAAAQ